MQGSRNRPTTEERRLLEILEEREPGRWSYVGDGQLIIGGKNPDFWDGEKRLMEMWGDFWHQGQDPQDRIRFFEDRGYSCRVIWASQLKELL
jgi:hypothetical protein